MKIEDLQQERAKVKEALMDLLRNQHVEIEFDKLDGTVRTITASLMVGDIPQYEKKTERVKPKREDQITVVDIEKKMWRNIKIDNIRKFTVLGA